MRAEWARKIANKKNKYKNDLVKMHILHYIYPLALSGKYSMKVDASNLDSDDVSELRVLGYRVSVNRDNPDDECWEISWAK